MAAKNAAHICWGTKACCTRPHHWSWQLSLPTSQSEFHIQFGDIKQGFLYLKPIVFFHILHTHQWIIITVLPELLLQGQNLDSLNTLIVNSLNMEMEQEMTSFCPGSSCLLTDLQMKGSNKQLEHTYILHCRSCLQLTCMAASLYSQCQVEKKNMNSHSCASHWELLL